MTEQQEPVTYEKVMESITAYKLPDNQCYYFDIATLIGQKGWQL